MTDPFIIQIPPKLANDPELAPYFDFLSKVLHDLTTVQSEEEPQAAIGSGSITAYTPHASGAVAVVSAAATDLDTTAAALDTLNSEVSDLNDRVESVLAVLRVDGTIAT